MAIFSTGTHVIATRALQDRLRQFHVAKGTAGVIVGRSGFFVTTYRVKFGHGREQAIIDRIPARGLRLDPKSIKNRAMLRPSPRKH